MTVGKLCSRIVHLADAAENVRVAADRMRSENVGTLVVLDGDRRPVGIVTDRDLALRVVRPALDCRTTTVGDVMTAHPRTVGEETPVEAAVETLRVLGIRRLPVVDADGRLVGILSFDDVLERVSAELDGLRRIVGISHAGTGLPATRRRDPPARTPALAGLERARGDLEC